MLTEPNQTKSELKSQLRCWVKISEQKKMAQIPIFAKKYRILLIEKLPFKKSIQALLESWPVPGNVWSLLL
jgi:hypothetical protein